MKTSTAAAIIGLMFSVFFAAVTDTYADYEKLTESVLRLHILADSDSDEDQALKLAVRDALLNCSSDIFGKCADRDEILKTASANLGKIKQTAEKTLTENGCDDTVAAELVKMRFDTRRYSDITMPEGEYTALRITIGRGEGHNWWCVMYPPLCIPCFSADGNEEVLSDEYGDIVADPENIQVRLYCAELADKIIDFLFGSGRE